MRRSSIVVLALCLPLVREADAGELAPGNSGASDTATVIQLMDPHPVGSGLTVAQACCKVCRKGRACGDSCIARGKTCTRPPGCACDAQ